MSHCRDFEEALWEAAEGRPLSAAAEAHLRTCESCRATVRRLSAASHGFEALRAVEAPDPSAAVWQRVRRPVRRPAFALAWAAGAIACVVAGTFALRHVPAPHPTAPVAPVKRIGGAPEAPPPAPVRPNTSVEEIVQPVEVHAGSHGRGGIGGERRASAHRDTTTAKQHERQQPGALAQTQLVEAPAGEVTVVEAADTPCSEAAALAYRAIGRGLVAQFLSGKGETG